MRMLYQEMMYKLSLRSLLILISVLIFTYSCKDRGRGDNEPDQIIDRETMIMLMADMDIIDAALKVKQAGLSHDSISKLANRSFDSLYLYYKTTPEIFSQNMRYYQTDMEDFEKMVDDKITLLSKKKDSLTITPEKLDTSKIKVRSVKVGIDTIKSK